MIRLGYRTPTVKDINREEKVLLAKELGLYVIELGAGELQTEKDINEWSELSAKHGILIKSCGININLCNPVLEEISDKTIIKSLKHAKALDLDVVFTRTDMPPNGMHQKEVWKYLIRKTREYASLCSENGMKFAIEVDPPCFIHTLERAIELLDNVNDDKLFLNYDPTNMYITGSNPINAIKILKNKISGGHIKDGIYRTEYRGETNIGYGELNYEDIFKTLSEFKIDIIMYYEHCKNSAEVRNAHKYIKKILDDIR